MDCNSGLEVLATFSALNRNASTAHSEHSTQCVVSMASGNDAIADILLQLSQDVSDFEAGKSVRVLQGAPSSDEFLRTFVSKNRPCLCRGAVAWPALAGTSA